GVLLAIFTDDGPIALHDRSRAHRLGRYAVAMLAPFAASAYCERGALAIRVDLAKRGVKFAFKVWVVQIAVEGAKIPAHDWRVLAEAGSEIIAGPEART